MTLNSQKVLPINIYISTLFFSLRKKISKRYSPLSMVSNYADADADADADNIYWWSVWWS